MSTIPSSLAALYNNASPGTLPTNTATKDYKQQFLNLLMAQMKNQDPTSPMDSKDMLAQQAQFESLEQMQNLNTNFVALMAMQNTNQAAALLGKTITGKVNGLTVSGVAQSVKFVNGTPKLEVLTMPGSLVQEMSLTDISEVSL